MGERSSVQATCCHCSTRCGVIVEVEADRPVAIHGDPDHPLTRGFICKRGLAAIEYYDHPGRLNRPMKRVGARGEGRWAELSWDEAIDEIADSLRGIIERDGPEAVAHASGTFHGPDVGAIGYRFLNHLGSPNSVNVWSICAGPQIVAESLTYGFGPSTPDFIPGRNRLVLLWGRHPSASNPPQWGRILAAKRAGATLIVIDPRRTQEAQAADLWLRPRPGSDAALALGFLHVVIAEGLYDQDFVARWTAGFDALAERVKDYHPPRVAEITWLTPEEVSRAARLYATSRPAVLSSGTPNGMGRNALSFERAKACLIAISGNLDARGGNRLLGPPRNVLTWADVEDNGLLSPAQRAKRLGAERFRLLGEGWERLNDAMRKVWSRECVIGGSVAGHAHAPSLWRAILSERPYPIRALFVQHNNVLGAYPNAKLVYEALRSPNLQLLVVHEQFMTPTAQLADYVLPAAGWLEKPFLFAGAGVVAHEPALPAIGARRSDYQLFADLAARLGHGNAWPSSLEAFFDMMLRPAGLRFAEIARRPRPWLEDLGAARQHRERDAATEEPRGFGTPTGKVELASTILEALGYDAVPRFEEPLDAAFGAPEEYPFLLSTGATQIEFTHQDHRQISALRRRHPDPTVEIAPETAQALEITDGDWVWIETPRGRVRQRAKLSPALHPQVVNAERWWYPERAGEDPELYGIWESNINACTEDDPALCDPAYGAWPFRLGRCRLRKA